jgi:hypothetical protein
MGKFERKRYHFHAKKRIWLDERSFSVPFGKFVQNGNHSALFLVEFS